MHPNCNVDYSQCCSVAKLAPMLQIVQEMVEEVVEQLVVIQSQRAGVPRQVLFPFVPARAPRRLQAPAAVYAGV